MMNNYTSKTSNEYYQGYRLGCKDGYDMHDAYNFWKINNAPNNFLYGYDEGYLLGWKEYEKKNEVDIPMYYHTLGDNRCKYSLRFAQEGPWKNIGPLPPPFDAITETEEEKKERELFEQKEKQQEKEYMKNAQFEHSKKIEIIALKTRQQIGKIRENFTPLVKKETVRRKKRKTGWRGQNRKQIFRRKR